MTKAFSILHRAAALLVALCLLVGMALPVYAAEDGALFFDAGSETIPTIPAANTSSEGVEPAQEPIVSDLETIPDEGDTPPTANEPGTEAGDTVNNTAAVPNNDGKTQEAAENQTPAADTDTAPADPALTNKTPADTSDTAAAPNHAINAEEATAAKTNTEQDVLFADGDNPNEEDTMPADDSPDNDDANTPDTIADTSVSTGFIPATTTIYFAVDNTIFRDSYRVHLYAHKLDDSGLDKDMVDTGTTTTDGRKIYSVTLNQADYSAGGFYRLIFQYFDDHVPDQNQRFKGQFFAFGGESGDDNGNGFKKETAINKIAGQMFDGNKGSNRGKAFDPAQWTRVEYYYKDMPLYFKNASGAPLTNVTAVFYKQDENDKTKTVKTASLPIGTVGANQFYAQKILIPDNKSQFVKFTWDGGESALYNFSTDPYDNVPTFDLTKANCFVYSADPTSSWQSAGSDLLKANKTIYFDATLSSYSYANDPDIHQSPMPDDGKPMYCFLTGSDGSTVETVKMEKVPDSATPDRKLWSCKIPDDKTYTEVQFSAVDSTTTIAKDNKTKKYSTAEIPPTLQEPCFFADDGDPSAYTSSNDDVFRDGYWGEKSSRHNAESGKSATVVDIDNSGTFTQQKDTKYITSTLYDYYTDYELNGLNRDSAPIIDGSSQRRFVTFEQFDRALSSAYTKSDNVKYPLYTGHFEPTGGASFAGVAGGMKLYGWDSNTNSDKYKIFMAVNNSTYDDKGGQQSGDYSRTFQGLVESKTSDGSANGLPLLRAKDSITTNALVDPHFDEAFLQGKNSFNTVLGKVYKDVSFPFTKDAVFKSSTNPNDPEQYAEYWYYDSSKASLYLKQDKGDGKYYLESPIDGEGKPTTHANSKNINASHGFFPFNQTVSTVGASQYNYGFGAKLQFDFTLTDDGQVVAGNDSNTKVPIKFFFSGDDDVWVYIDGKLVLDVGGAHGKASGLLEFGKDNTVTPYVSSNKNTDTKDPMVYTTDAKNKTVYFNQTPITFTKTTSKAIPLDKDLTTHTLTMFYMERGMWDSNMAVAFNFPDHNELQVEKQVDVSDVNPLFQDSFKNQKIFTFNIQNLATHYEAKATDEPAIETEKLPDTAYSTATGLSYVSSLPEDVGTGSAVLWESDVKDPTSAYRTERRGTLTCGTPIDISGYSYLTFDVYVQGSQTDTCALSNLYVELWDTGGKQMGCLGTKGLRSSDVYGAATALHPGTWYTVQLMLNSLQKEKGFNNKQLAKITVGDNFARSIYLRNFTFSSAPTMPEQTGFTTAQYDVPDYGSAETGTLQNAAYAVFSSSDGTGNVVNENGDFLLEAGETVTFNDQFRRGSYIALKELTDTELYDTSWTVYENGVPVTKVNGNTNVVTMGDHRSLQNVKGTTPNDDRTEKVVADGELDGHPIQNEYKVAKKPDTDTLVFRSYSDKADANELTKLKVVYTNTVKTGKLIIRKVPAEGEGEQLKDQEFTFAVRFGDVGGQSLGEKIDPIQCKCTVENHDGQYYGEVEIEGIPVGTQFVVSEIKQLGTSLKSVSIEGGKDCATTEDGWAYGTIVKDSPVKATFENTARELIDITVNKEWKTQDGKTDIPQADLPTAIYLRLQRTETPDVVDSWQTVPGCDRVELTPDVYKGWIHLFTGLDKNDAGKTGIDRVDYTYRVLESATGKDDDWHGGGDVIEIGGKRYKVLNTPVKADSDNITLTLTNQLQDAKYNLVITKQDAQNNSIKLGGVEFKLEKLNDSGAAETTYNGVTGSDSTNQGKCSFASLTPGSYRLTETKTAEGYTLLAEPIEFTLTADGQCRRGDETFGKITPGADGVYNIALTIYNRKGFTLPHTGADAPSLWLLIGLPALVAVLLVLVFRYNKKGGKHS